MSRLCIYPKDIAMILGKSQRTGRDIHKKIREKLNKTKEQCITIPEFSSYIGIPVDLLEKRLKK